MHDKISRAKLSEVNKCVLKQVNFLPRWETGQTRARTTGFLRELPPVPQGFVQSSKPAHCKHSKGINYYTLKQKEWIWHSQLQS